MNNNEDFDLRDAPALLEEAWFDRFEQQGSSTPGEFINGVRTQIAGTTPNNGFIVNRYTHPMKNSRRWCMAKEERY